MKPLKLEQIQTAPCTTACRKDVDGILAAIAEECEAASRLNGCRTQTCRHGSDRVYKSHFSDVMSGEVRLPRSYICRMPKYRRSINNFVSDFCGNDATVIYAVASREQNLWTNERPRASRSTTGVQKSHHGIGG